VNVTQSACSAALLQPLPLLHSRLLPLQQVVVPLQPQPQLLQPEHLLGYCAHWLL